MKSRSFSLFTLAICLSAMVMPWANAIDGTNVSVNKQPQRPGEILLAQAKQRESKIKPTKAQAGSATKSSTGKSIAKSKRLAPITAEIEDEVVLFVREHHQELLDVLNHLKANLPKEYERAVRELNRNRLRLQQLAGRDRYDAELELWKAQSRARLLGARVQMGDDDAHRKALRATLAEIYDLRADLLRKDRDRASERLKRLDEQLLSLENDREKNLEKQLLALTKPNTKRAKPVKTSSRSGKSAANTKSPTKN